MKELVEAIDDILGNENKKQVDNDAIVLPVCGSAINKLRAELSKFTAPHQVSIGHMEALYKACGGHEPMTKKSVEALIKRQQVNMILRHHEVQTSTDESGSWKASCGIYICEGDSREDAILGILKAMGYAL